MEPTSAELMAIVDVGSLLDWAGLDNTTPVQPASGNPMVAARSSFLAWAQIGPTQHFRCLSMLPQGAFQAQLVNWTCNGTAPSMGSTLAVLLAQQTARYICKQEMWPSCAAAAASAAIAAQTAQAAPNPALAPTSNLINTPTIKIGRVIDQKLDEEITYLPQAELQAMYSRYIKIMEEKPPQDVAVTPEQLTALQHILTTGRPPYVDMSVFGPHFVRMQKRIALAGAKMDARGVMRDVEMYGPPNIDAWLQSYDCLVTALIMLNTVSRPNLAAYRKLIVKYATQYGAAVWHLLYLADVRCRQELMECTKMELFEDHNTNLAAGLNSNFDVTRPWDSVWKKVTGDSDWWQDQFKEQAILVLTKTANLNSMVEDSEAPITSGHGGYSPPPGAHTVKRPTKPKNPKPAAFSTEGLTKNKKGKFICPGFQDGSCTHTVGSAQCSKNPQLLHQCTNCLENGHGAHFPQTCTVEKRRFGKGKKGKGKGNKGKGKH
jgi:hypothetical protein